jgi:hypothetical protein
MGALRLADHECPYSIWMEQDAFGGWSWELIDKNGETNRAGRSRDRKTALEHARRAAAREERAAPSLSAEQYSGC